jgi:hypothetical protein
LLLWLALVVAGVSLVVDSPSILAPCDAQSHDFESKKIVPFVPFPQEVVDKMIELAGVDSPFLPPRPCRGGASASKQILA